MIIIIIKEVRELLYNRKFVATMAVGVLLVIVSIVNGYLNYQNELERSAKSNEAAIDYLSASLNYRLAKGSGFIYSREPEKLSIFTRGINDAVGLNSDVMGRRYEMRPKDSRNSQDPVRALFGGVDLTFIVGTILSLYALLFSFRTISGEKELGTLPLIFANNVKRSSVYTGKMIGIFITVLLLFIIPFILGILLLLLTTDLSFTAAEWLSIFMTGLTSAVYLLLFVVIGLAISASTKESLASILFCLLVWILSVTIVPMLSGNLSSLFVKRIEISDVEYKIKKRAVELREERMRKLYSMLTREKIPGPEFGEKQQEFSNELWKEYGEKLDEYEAQVFGEYIRNRNKLAELTVTISRISPTFCLTYANSNIADTGPEMLGNFEKQLYRYNKNLTDYLDKKQESLPEEQREPRGVFLNYYDDGEGGIRVELEDKSYFLGKLDMTGFPRIGKESEDNFVGIRASIIDIGILCIQALIVYLIGFVRFLKYDVR